MAIRGLECQASMTAHWCASLRDRSSPKDRRHLHHQPASFSWLALEQVRGQVQVRAQALASWLDHLAFSPWDALLGPQEASSLVSGELVQAPELVQP